MTVSTYSTGWCFTCGTNACEHVKHLNVCNQTAFNTLLRALQEQKPKIKLPGLTGEPWRK